MQYENRQPKEGINVTHEHPLKLFFKLAIAALVIVVLLVIFLQVSGAWVAKRVPFGFELTVMEELSVDFGHNADHPQMAAYLNDLAQRVASEMNLPEGMTLQVSYNSEDVFNAFATVGGNLIFYKGLLEGMPDENTLAMVMAHEIAHVLHRDPVASLGGGMASAMVLLALTGSTGSTTAGALLNGAGSITSVQFTRGMEESADESALAALNGTYGHVNGATALFDLFSGARSGSSGDEPGTTQGSSDVLEGFFSTHPRDQDRVSAVRDRAMDEGWSMHGALTPLPAGFDTWL